MADIQSAEEAAKVKELEATLDFLKVKKPENSEAVNAERSEAKDSHGTDKNNENKAEGVLKDHSVVSSMSELDRARASRFAPPKHVLEQMAEHKTVSPAEEKAAGNSKNTEENVKNEAKPALHLAMTVDEAKKQGILAPGTYGKPDEKTAEKAENNKPKPAQPIKNPLPIPKKHEAKDMDFDHDIPLLDMHFDVVDMSGMDFFDIN